MKYNPQIHHRKSIRLKGYDYSDGGWYFVTVCSKNRELLFGTVLDDKILLNEWGKIVENEWLKTSEIRKNIEIDNYIIMPNHLHGIIGIVDQDEGVSGKEIIGIVNQDVRAYCNTPQREKSQSKSFKSPSKTIGAIIRGFKSAVTKKINIIRNSPNLSVWQRNYFERVIRNEPELNRIRKYIIDNPIKWQFDQNNPVNLDKTNT